MTRVQFEYDEATTIVLPGPDLQQDAVAVWAEQAAARLAAHHPVGRIDAVALAGVIAHAQKVAEADPSTHGLVFEPATGLWAPVRLSLAAELIADPEQRRYLWPPAIIAPRVRLATSRLLGTGCSSTFVDENGLGVVRWLFAASSKMLFAEVGPVPPPALVPVAAIVEALLDTVRIDGATPGPVAGFDPDVLAVMADDIEASWQM